jgi:probable HAF family extracellular repeat protein
MTALGSLGGGHSEAVAINERGQVIGDSIPAGRQGSSHAFVWQQGTMTDLGTLGGAESVPKAMNENNQIVGVSTTRIRNSTGHAVLWTLRPGS